MRMAHLKGTKPSWMLTFRERVDQWWMNNSHFLLQLPMDECPCSIAVIVVVRVVSIVLGVYIVSNSRGSWSSPFIIMHTCDAHILSDN